MCWCRENLTVEERMCLKWLIRREMNRAVKEYSNGVGDISESSGEAVLRDSTGEAGEGRKGEQGNGG